MARPGTFTFTYGHEHVTLDPLLPRDEFDRRMEQMKELQARAFRNLRTLHPDTPEER